MPTKEASRFRRRNSGLAAGTPPIVGVTTTMQPESKLTIPEGRKLVVPSGVSIVQY